MGFRQDAYEASDIDEDLFDNGNLLSLVISVTNNVVMKCYSMRGVSLLDTKKPSIKLLKSIIKMQLKKENA